MKTKCHIDGIDGIYLEPKKSIILIVKVFMRFRSLWSNSESSESIERFSITNNWGVVYVYDKQHAPHPLKHFFESSIRICDNYLHKKDAADIGVFYRLPTKL